jgi:hypothetical protein
MIGQRRAVLIASKIGANAPRYRGTHLYNSTLIRLCRIGLVQDQSRELGGNFSAAAGEAR